MSHLDTLQTTWTRRRWLSAASVVAGGLAAPACAGPAPASGAIPVAMVVDEGATLIDFAGPWEVLSSAAYFSKGFSVYSVSRAGNPIYADDGRGGGSNFPRSGLKIVPDFSFANAPQPKVILTGAQSYDDPAKIGWIRKASKGAEVTSSVCNGAFLLASTGLLDGHSATCNRRAYERFEKAFPKVKLVRGVRFVDDGPVATATGLTAGIELALHIVERFYGRDVAQQVAGYEEWQSSAWMT